MSKKFDSTDKENVVVVGGGFAGLPAVKELAKKLDKSRFNLVLITSRPYFVHYPALIRMTVSDADNLDQTSLIPYDKLHGFTLKVGTVNAIEETAPGKGGHVVLKDGERVPYAALLLATGSVWTGPINFGSTDEEIRHDIKTWRSRYASARHIAIVGGGAVGVETVGEIKDVYPSTKVTLVHSEDQLLNNAYPNKVRRATEQRVRLRGAEIIYNDYVDALPEPGTTVDITTRKGKVIKGVDLVVQAFGAKPATAFIHTLDSAVLTSSNTVKVQPTLELVNHPGIFAVGDIIDWKEQKQAGKCLKHAAIATANILSFLSGQPQSKKYAGQVEIIVIPVGKNYGVSYFDVLWGILLGDWVSKLVKGKSLLVSMSRGNLGY